MHAPAQRSYETVKVADQGVKLRVVARDKNWVQVNDPATSTAGWIYDRLPPGPPTRAIAQVSKFHCPWQSALAPAMADDDPSVLNEDRLKGLFGQNFGAPISLSMRRSDIAPRARAPAGLHPYAITTIVGALNGRMPDHTPGVLRPCCALRPRPSGAALRLDFLLGGGVLIAAHIAENLGCAALSSLEAPSSRLSMADALAS